MPEYLFIKPLLDLLEYYMKSQKLLAMLLADEIEYFYF